MVDKVDNSVYNLFLKKLRAFSEFSSVDNFLFMVYTALVCVAHYVKMLHRTAFRLSFPPSGHFL